MGTDRTTAAEAIGRRMGRARADMLLELARLSDLEQRVVAIADERDAASERLADAERRYLAAVLDGAALLDDDRAEKAERAAARDAVGMMPEGGEWP